MSVRVLVCQCAPPRARTSLHFTYFCQVWNRRREYLYVLNMSFIFMGFIVRGLWKSQRILVYFDYWLFILFEYRAVLRPRMPRGRAEWYRIFADNQYADVSLDRLQMCVCFYPPDCRVHDVSHAHSYRHGPLSDADIMFSNMYRFTGQTENIASCIQHDVFVDATSTFFSIDMKLQFTLPSQCGNHGPILRLAACLRVTDAEKGGKVFCSGSDPPP